jgi:hypothetical protein
MDTRRDLEGCQVDEGRIFNIFDFQTFKVTVDFTPPLQVDGHAAPQESVHHEKAACIKRLEELAASQHDANGG